MAGVGRMGYVLRRRREGVRQRDGGVRRVIGAGDLMMALHGGDIYRGFDYAAHPNNPSGWGGESPAFSEIIRRCRPKFIVEVGSWLGSSAITMANALGDSGGGTILCIDTWLGALEFWEDQADPERFQALACRHGFPQVYFGFLANVCHAGHQERIVPFPIHSSGGALWLLRQGLKADLIYIDASHEEEDVYQDLLDFAPLVRKEGILFGDDWAWSGVRAAVERFAAGEGLAIEHLHDKWLLTMR